MHIVKQLAIQCAYDKYSVYNQDSMYMSAVLKLI